MSKRGKLTAKDKELLNKWETERENKYKASRANKTNEQAEDTGVGKKRKGLPTGYDWLED